MASRIDIERDAPDSSLARSIRSMLYKRGMVYDRKEKRFILESPIVTDTVNLRLEEMCLDFYQIKGEDSKSRGVLIKINQFINRVIELTDFKPKEVSLRESIDPFEIELFQHIVLKERNAQTDLLALGDGKFMVLNSNRSTLRRLDILEAIKSPWQADVGEGFTFFIERDKERYNPDGQMLELEFQGKRYDILYNFITQPINEVIFCSSSTLSITIDDRVEVEGVLKPGNHERAIHVVKTIVEHIEDADGDYDEKNYESLHKMAISASLNSYKLNLLIEMVEALNLDQPESPFIKEDWERVEPEGLREEREKQKLKEDIAAVAKIKQEYEENLKVKLESGRFLLIFKRSGYYSRRSRAELREISNQLDHYVKLGLCESFWAENIKGNYLRRHRVSPSRNIFVGSIALLIIFAIGGVSLITVLTNNGLKKFNKIVDVGLEQVEQKQFKEAQATFTQAYEEFTPKLTTLLAKVRYNNLTKQVERAIDKEVEEGVRQIELWLKADKGKFEEHTYNRLMEIYRLRPEHSGVLEKMELWKNQF